MVTLCTRFRTLWELDAFCWQGRPLRLDKRQFIKIYHTGHITDVYCQHPSSTADLWHARVPSIAALGAASSQWQHFLRWMFHANLRSCDCEGTRRNSFSFGRGPRFGKQQLSFGSPVLNAPDVLLLLSECVVALRLTQKEIAPPHTRTPSTPLAGCGAQCARVFPMLLGANAPWVRMVNDSGAMG